jgi:23S rRNA (adenine2503-C2)-methyltransferase
MYEGQPRPHEINNTMRRRLRYTAAASAAPAAAATPAQQPPLSTTMPRPPLSFEGRAGLRDSRGRVMLKNLTLPELEEWCGHIGEPQPRRRALQIWRWMYADGNWAGAPEDTVGIQNGLSARFCERIRDEASFDGGLALASVARSGDGTRKLVFKLTEGEGAGAVFLGGGEGLCLPFAHTFGARARARPLACRFTLSFPPTSPPTTNHHQPQQKHKKGGTVETVLIPVVREAGAKPRVTLCVSCQVGCAMGCAFCMTGTLGFAANLSAAQIVEQMVQARRLQAAEGDDVPITNVV